jgi:hypothetical protein
MSLGFLRSATPVLIVLAATSATAIAQDDPRHPEVGIALSTSPFPAPEKTEQTFVIDDGSGLDTGCTFRSGGPLRIRLPIDRHIGDVARLRAGGLVPATVRLEMPAFDVDTAGAPGFPPERDRVSVNGNVVPGEFLTGLNNTWIAQRFDIPIEWLRFPADPGEGGSITPAINDIVIDIDTLSPPAQNWCTAIDWAAVTIPAPRPWVGAHGILSNSGVWHTLWVPALTSLGIPVADGDDMGRLDSIANNAAKIGVEVEKAKRRWGVERINLVGHSKGGLDSREYILGAGSDSVERLVQLGTPNAGSPLADVAQAGLIGLLGIGGAIIANELAGPAGVQLTTPYMALYNVFHGRNARTTYTSVAGNYTAGGFFQDFLNRLLIAVVGPGDTIVPRTSVHALPYAAHLDVFSSYPDSRATHTSMHANGDAFNAVLSQITGPGTLGAAAVQSTLAVVPELQRSETVGGRLGAGQTRTHTLTVDAAAQTAFTLLYLDGEVDLALTSPLGEVFDSTTIIGNPLVSREDREILGGRMQVYGFNGPIATGDWTATVTVRNAAAPVDYILTAFFEGSSVALTAALSDGAIRVGNSFELTATVVSASSPVLDASVRVRVILPDGTAGPEVTLLDTGLAPDTVANDGVYTGTVGGAVQPGNYGFAVRASTGSSGVAFSREAYLLGTASLSASTVNVSSIQDFGRDTNANGLFDSLVVRVPVTVTNAARYRLAGVLRDSAGNTLFASTAAPLTPGLHAMDLAFDGATIGTRGVNGPYDLVELRLAEETDIAILPVDEAATSYRTRAYAASEFEGAFVAFLGGTAVGVDTNGNGKFDLLRVDLNLNLRSAGFYQWSGRLRDRNGREIALAQGSGNLPGGLTVIRLDFPGLAIGQSGTDGPYEITDLLFFGAAATLSVPNVLVTAAFRADQFEGFQGSLGPPRLSGAIVGQSATGPNTLQVQLRITNSGLGPARTVFVDQLAFRVLSGPATSPVTAQAPALPISLGDINPGASVTVTLTLTVPAGVRRFGIYETGRLAVQSGDVLTFSMGQSITLR